MFVKNKRGNIPIVALVVLTLVLTTSTLLLFNLNGKKAVTETVSSSFLDGMYFQENIAKYYVYVVASELKRNESFSEDNFKDFFGKLEFEEDYLIVLQNTISQGNFELDENNFRLRGATMIFLVNSKDLSATYSSYLEVDLDKTKEQEYYLNKGNSINDAS